MERPRELSVGFDESDADKSRGGKKKNRGTETLMCVKIVSPILNQKIFRARVENAATVQIFG